MTQLRSHADADSDLDGKNDNRMLAAGAGLVTALGVALTPAIGHAEEHTASPHEASGHKDPIGMEVGVTVGAAIHHALEEGDEGREESHFFMVPALHLFVTVPFGDHHGWHGAATAKFGSTWGKRENLKDVDTPPGFDAGTLLSLVTPEIHRTSVPGIFHFSAGVGFGVAKGVGKEEHEPVHPEALIALEVAAESDKKGPITFEVIVGVEAALSLHTPGSYVIQPGIGVIGKF